MRIVLSTLGILLGVAGIASAQTTGDNAAKYAGRYFCNVTAGGGVAWEESQKQWVGAAFRPEGSFVVSVSAAPEINAGVYKVLISAMGDDRPRTCDVDRSGYLEINEWGVVRCSALLHEYRMSLRELRFIKAYLVGYVSGEDNNDNTPSITIGQCTRIE